MKIFTDSGAFSAYHNKTTVNIQNYIDFIKENKEDIETYANLDDIGSPEGTWKNQEEMERQGLCPIPVYHLGESYSYLDRCMEYEYFAVGGIASKLTSPGSLKSALSVVFKRLCTEKTNFFPSNKIHGFGIAAPTLLVEYPWYSADTTSWAQYGRFGIILIPNQRNGKPNFDLPPYTVTVSSRSKAIGEEDHYRNLPSMIKEWITKYCAEIGCPIGRTLYKTVQPGYTLKENEKWTDRKVKDRVEIIIDRGLCCDGEMRDKVNLHYFLSLEKYQKKWPWQWYPEAELFS